MAWPSRTGGKASHAKTRKANPSKGSKTNKTKRRIAPKPNKGRSVAELETKLERQAWELDEARQQQTATADVLKVISRSSVDLKTVLDTLCETVARLCRADQAPLYRWQDDKHHLVAAWGMSEEARQFGLAHPLTPGRGTVTGRVILERRAIHVPDVLQDLEYTYSEGQKAIRYRTLLGIPLLREDALLCVFAISRTWVEPFTDKEIELATTFADQAVIAIENTRLFNELQARTRDVTEALTYQTGSANILRVIASSPTDVEPVLKAIVESACELCGAYDAVVRLKDGDGLAFGAHHGPLPAV